MLDSDSGYHGTKRATLIFSVATLLLCAAGTKFTGFSIAGISFGEPSATLLKAFIFLGALYYFVLYMMTAYLDGKTELLSKEHNEENLETLLRSSLSRIDAAEEKLQPLLTEALSKFETGDLRRLKKDIQQLTTKESLIVKVDIPTSSMNSIMMHSPELFNFVSSAIRQIEDRVPESRQFKLAEIKEEILKSIASDANTKLAADCANKVSALWTGLNGRLQGLTQSISTLEKNYMSELEGYHSDISTLREPIRSALFEVKILRSIRSMKFWVFEGAVVALLFATAFAHYVGEFWAPLPSLIG